MTALTDDCRERIDGERVSGVGSVVQVLGLGQVVFGGEGRKEGNEVEAVSLRSFSLEWSRLKAREGRGYWWARRLRLGITLVTTTNDHINRLSQLHLNSCAQIY